MKGNYLLYVGLAFTLIPLLLSFYLYSEQRFYFSGVLSGLVSVGVGILVVNILIERYLRDQEQEEWKYAETAIVSPVFFHCSAILLAATFHLANEREVVSAWDKLSNLIKKGERTYEENKGLRQAIFDYKIAVDASLKRTKDESEFLEHCLEFHQKIIDPVSKIVDVHYPPSLTVVKNPTVFSGFFRFQKQTREAFEKFESSETRMFYYAANDVIFATTSLLLNFTHYEMIKKNPLRNSALKRLIYNVNSYFRKLEE